MPVFCHRNSRCAKDIYTAEQLLQPVQDATEQSRAQARLEYLKMRLQLYRRQPVSLQLEEQYRQPMLTRLAAQKDE